MRGETDYIETFTGIKFYPFAPRANEINILDIAHSLSQQCRFGGHCKIFYSVAQHSLWTAKILKDKGADPLIQLYGLLHDGTEPYMMDLPTPIKKQLPKYKKAENVLHNILWEALGLPFPTEEQWKAVKEIDEMLKQFEATSLLTFAHWADHSVQIENMEIIEELPSVVKQRFLDEYTSLSKELEMKK